LLGPNGDAMLQVPWSYRIPAGLATILAFVVVVAVIGYRSATARANRLLKEDKFQEALQLYARNLPADTEPTAEERQQAFAAGVEFLVNRGVDPDKAEASLRLLVAEMDKDTSYLLRNQAVEHEQAGEWEQAIELYERAARLRVESDLKDHEFLLKCIERVRKKQGRG
jgi:tetratricopeptide (TPR) repeat protein